MHKGHRQTLAHIRTDTLAHIRTDTLAHIRTDTQTENLTYQFSRGQMTLVAVAEQVSKQLQGQRTYFLPGGGEAIGWE